MKHNRSGNRCRILAGECKGRRANTLDGLAEFGIEIDDGGIVAGQLHDGVFELPLSGPNRSDFGADLRAQLRRSAKRHDGDVAVAHQCHGDVTGRGQADEGVLGEAQEGECRGRGPRCSAPSREEAGAKAVERSRQEGHVEASWAKRRKAKG